MSINKITNHNLFNPPAERNESALSSNYNAKINRFIL